MSNTTPCVPLSMTLLLVVAAAATTAQAADIQVDPQHPQCASRPGRMYCALQPAVDAAAVGDTVTVAAGTYDLWTETLRLDKSITLRGAGLGRTVLDGGGAHDGPVLDITPDADEVRIEGLTITNRVRHGSNLRRAAGVDHRGQGLILQDVEISNTQGGWGGGLSTGAPLAEVVIRASRFTGNTGLTGAGVDIRNAPGTRLEIHDSSFTGNSAIFTGGGLFIRDVGEVLLSGVRIEGNSSGNRGAGIFIAVDRESGTLSVMNSVVQGNASKGAGGIAASGATLSISLEGVAFKDNVSAGEPSRSDCTSDHPAVFRSLGGNSGNCVGDGAASGG